MIDIRDNSYISLLFVDKEYQGKDSAKGFFNEFKYLIHAK
jgi:hypothetical protein